MIPDLLALNSNLHLVITIILKNKTTQTNKQTNQELRQEHLWYIPAVLQEK